MKNTSLISVLLVLFASCGNPTQGDIESLNKIETIEHELYSNTIGPTPTDPTDPTPTDPTPSNHYDMGMDIGCTLRIQGFNEIYNATVQYASQHGLTQYLVGLQEGWSSCVPEFSSSCVNVSSINIPSQYRVRVYANNQLIGVVTVTDNPDSMITTKDCNRIFK